MQLYMKFRIKLFTTFWTSWRSNFFGVNSEIDKTFSFLCQPPHLPTRNTSVQQTTYPPFE